MSEEKKEVLLELRGIKTFFPVRSGFFNKVTDYVQAVNNVDLDIYRGETLGLVGESGCGKTTTLTIVAGFQKPTEGIIEVNGNVVTKPGPDRAFMFQNYALFPNMTVYDNIASPLVARRLDKTIIHDLVIQLMKELHIEGLEKRYPRQLSGGQKQRVALARLLIYNAEAILLDEPFSALDEDLKGVLLKEMKTKLDAYHRPVVFVSHNKDEIKALSHEMDIIKKGEMIHEEIS